MAGKKFWFVTYLERVANDGEYGRRTILGPFLTEKEAARHCVPSRAACGQYMIPGCDPGHGSVGIEKLPRVRPGFLNERIGLSISETIPRAKDGPSDDEAMVCGRLELLRAGSVEAWFGTEEDCRALARLRGCEVVKGSAPEEFDGGRGHVGKVWLVTQTLGGTPVPPDHPCNAHAGKWRVVFTPSAWWTKPATLSA